MGAHHLIRCDETDRRTLFAGARGAADTVNMHFRVERELIVHHHLQRFDIETARGDVGGHQHAAAAVGKADQHPVTVALFQIAMQRQCADAAVFQRVGDVVALAFGIAEHHTGSGLTLA